MEKMDRLHLFSILSVMPKKEAHKKLQELGYKRKSSRLPYALWEGPYGQVLEQRFSKFSSFY
jgi:hypothetical protein